MPTRSSDLPDEIARFDRQPLSGRRILVTRPQAQAESFARVLAARGAQPVVAPTIRIADPDDPLPAQRAVERRDAYDWLVFTSQNGVDAFFARLRACDGDARDLTKLKVAAIGGTTVAALERCGVRVDLVPSRYVGEALAHALIAAAEPGARVLVYGAAEARDVLPAMLTSAGLRPTTVAAYRTRIVDDPHFAFDVRQCEVLTFASGSAVRGFCALLGGDAPAGAAARGKIVACIGPVTADEARAHGLPVAIVAIPHTTEAMVAALEAHFATRAASSP